jgi:hypothetical protein
LTTTRSATGAGRRRKAAAGNALGRTTFPLLARCHAIDLCQRLTAQISDAAPIWSTKWQFHFRRATPVSFCGMRPKGNGPIFASEWIATDASNVRLPGRKIGAIESLFDRGLRSDEAEGIDGLFIHGLSLPLFCIL